MAQAMARGEPQYKAYEIAGYVSTDPTRDSSRAVRRFPEIAERADELLKMKAAGEAKAIDIAAERSGIDKAYVMRGLLENYERCMQVRPVLDRDGDMVYVETPSGQIAPAYAYDAKNAIRALHLMGLQLSMFAQRHVFVPDPFANLPVEVLKEALEALERMSKERVIDHESSGAPRLAAATTA